MKKTIIIAVSLLAVLMLANYLLGKTDTTKEAVFEEDKLVALSTFTIISDMVGEVGGDKVEAISLTKPGAEIHGYQPTPNDLIQASKADLMFQNGLNLEIWTEKLRAGLPDDIPMFTVSEGVEIVTIAEDAYAGKPNPHAWMSPQQGLVYVENIRRELAAADPANAEYYATNAAAYSAKIKAVDEKLAGVLATLLENNRVLVTCEGAFSYLTNDYGLEEVYLWAMNSDAMGSPQQITRVINLVNEKQIPAVFCESTVEPHIQQEVVEATDAIFGGILYVDSLSNDGGPATSYLSLLEHAANTIITGLTHNQ